MEFKSVSSMALKDISNYLEENGIIFKPYQDSWYISPNKLYTKESIYLNKKLGVSTINYTPEKMKRK